MGSFTRIAVAIVAAILTWAFTSLAIQAFFPMRDFGACLGVIFWLGLPLFVLIKTPQAWDAMVAAQRERAAAAEAKVRTAREAEERELAQTRQRADEARHREEEAALGREDAERRRIEKQERLQQRSAELVTASVKLVDDLPSVSQEAERALNRAEHEFAEGVFAPFWDEIETAVNQLARFNRDVDQVIANRKEYGSLRPAIEQPPTPFVVAVDLLPDASFVAERMRKIVRAAQKDFHFATIYEQRKTNRLLFQGFSSLGQAILGLSSSLHTSISDLKFSLGDKLSEIASGQQEAAAEALTEARQARESAALHAEQAAQMAAESAAASDEDRRLERELLGEIRDQTKPKE